MIFFNILFWINAFVIVWAMIGYKISLHILSKIFSRRIHQKDYNYRPTVTVMIVAHNEEKVILNKLNNVIDNDYPKDLIEYVVASDYCTDSTNDIVKKFINSNENLSIRLYCSKQHTGKTNAQNEAQKEVKSEILIMTDANSMFRKNTITEIVSSFSSQDIVYVTGKLSYMNSEDNDVALSESLYWDGDLVQRKIESNIRTITAGNGAIYAVRNEMYVDFPPIECHDSAMPYYYAKIGKRAVYNEDAVAYEKAGEIIEDEFKRKVRMNRGILKQILDGIKCMNIFKYGWFSYFYFGHRTCRYLLWSSHLIVLLISIGLSVINIFYFVSMVLQIVFYVTALIGMITKSKNRIISLVTYYTMTILAQLKGVYNCITGKSKPTWESAETTR